MIHLGTEPHNDQTIEDGRMGNVSEEENITSSLRKGRKRNRHKNSYGLDRK